MKKNPYPPAGFSGACAQRVIDFLFEQLERNLRDPSFVKGVHWQEWFGEKDCVILHTQKLVAAMKQLAELSRASDGASLLAEEAPLTPEEITLISDWLADGRGEFSP